MTTLTLAAMDCFRGSNPASYMLLFKCQLKINQHRAEHAYNNIGNDHRPQH